MNRVSVRKPKQKHKNVKGYNSEKFPGNEEMLQTVY